MLAHVEITAVHMYWDTVLRFDSADPAQALPFAFFDDFMSVIADEARHFKMVDGRLRALGHEYGAWPALDALWRLALSTRGDIAARLALVPLVQEARGLDAGPRYVERFLSAGDFLSAEITRTVVYVAMITFWTLQFAVSITLTLYIDE